MFRQTFGGPARFLVHDILHIPPNTLTARYAKILATFFVSGLLHLSTDLAGGIPLAESGAVRFFCTQALGICLEDSVQAVYRHFVPKKVLENSRSASREYLVQIIGYIWLILFLSWSTPVWVFPAIRRNTGTAEDRILPFSILEKLQWW